MEELKAKIEEIVKKLTDNKDLMESFKKDPIKTVEKLLGVDLPDETIEKIVDGGTHEPCNKPKYDVLQLAMTFDRPILLERIKTRLEARIKAGMPSFLL